jgi:prephenate dehydratase
MSNNIQTIELPLSNALPFREGRGGAKAFRIAIQGVAGAFHHIAAARHYQPQQQEKIDIVAANTFDDLVQYAENEQISDGALMAIENTIAGTLLYNYKLLNESNLKINGEVYLRIRQNLMVLPGQRIEDLTEVYSHPIAIMQCTKFFEAYPHIKLIEATDTALSAKRIKEEKMYHAGAIASSMAAEIYGMEIIAPSIETYKKNYTRFLVLEREGEQKEDFDKISICFSLHHEVGSLHKVLAAIALYGANLTKIQSVPIPDERWHYLFFIDFVLDSQRHYNLIMKELENQTEDLKVLGTYRTGVYYED